MKHAYPVFDSHTHAFPDAIAERAIASLAHSADIPHYHDGTFGGLCAYEANGGASGFLLLPIATKPSQMRSVNDWAASRTGGGVQAFGSIHPDAPDVFAELDHIASLGLRGIKLHPEYQDFFVDDARMFPIYEGIFARGLILYLHAGADLAFPPPIKGDPRRIAKVCDAFPDARIVAAHMGAFDQLAEVRESLVGRPNVWFDTSFSAERMAAGDIADVIRAHGVSRVMFGTDAPWSDFEVSLDAVCGAGLNEAELRAVLYGNAQRLLGLPDAEGAR